MTSHATATAAPLLRVSGPGDLIDAIPFLLGFHPHDSVVILGLTRGRVAVTARADVADALEPGCLASVVEAQARSGVDSVVAAIFVSTSPHEHDYHPVVAALATAADGCGVGLTDVLHVTRQRWWSYLCGNDACCPPEGRELPAGTSTAAATATYAGLVALGSRTELAATLAPAPAAERAALEPVIAEAESAAVRATLAGHSQRHGRSRTQAVFAAARTGADVLTDADVAALVADLACIPLRDAVWTAVDERRLDGRDVWRELARRAPAPYDAAPLFLFAWASWRRGDGALARIAVDRALDSDPNYAAAQMLREALDRAVDPRRLPRLRQRGTR